MSTQSLPAKIETPYLQSSTEVLDGLRVDGQKGLSKQEADKRAQTYGPNELERKRRKPLWKLMAEQFVSPLVWVLLVAAALAFSFQEWVEAISVLVVILINALIGFFMELQAMRSMDALRQLAASTARVYRDGHLREIPTRELTPGDILYLEAGDMVSADARLIELNDLSLKESALTGESTPVEKEVEALSEKVPIGDQRNMVFKGTAVLHGNGRAVVTAIGKHTQLGHIADLTHRASKEATPLEDKLARLSRRLLWLTFFLAALILLLGWAQGRDLYLMAKTAIALAVAAIPEGLPIVATIALARGMLRLARRQVIVKKLSAVETLGETDVIFTDKTGTLTENSLLADVLCFPDRQIRLQRGKGNAPWAGLGEDAEASAESVERLLQVAVLCNNASLEKRGEKETSVGDPLEVALLQMATGLGHSPEEKRKKFPRLREIPFDSDLKMMGTLHEQPNDNKYLVCIKGALEVVLEESDNLLARDGLVPFEQREQWLNLADDLAAKGLRVLALAYSEISEPEADFFQHLNFIGLVGFQDPPRQEVKPALASCREAGIEVIMITGDHPETARNIAYETGLTDGQDVPVVRGQDFLRGEKVSEEVQKKMLETRVFARVSPAQKLDLVTLYQGRGLTVGMTGDGVNDTPALKKADIGIAMGQRGTEAAKEVADIVLKDDAFSSIVMAIRQGRGIFENIRFFVIYLLSCNLSELLAVAIAYLLNMTMPLLPLQILFLNMVTDVFPALALGFNEEAEDIMQRPPRRRDEPVITRPMWGAIGFYALCITGATVGALLFATHGLGTDEAVANNFAFYTLILAQLWNVFNLTGVKESFFRNEVTRNPWVWGAIVLSVGVMVACFHIPLMREVLSLTDITWAHFGYILLFSLAPVAVVQLVKRLRIGVV